MDPIQYDIDSWLKENEKYFVPPICNKLMYKDGQLKTFFVGGPNSRKDFHLEAGEEFFYMLKGDMRLVVVERGQFKDVIIKEGEVFLLPACIPHSPQRSSNTMGLVIERERQKSEFDCIRYYVENSEEILYEKWFYCESLEAFGPLIKEYFESEAYRTGKPLPGSISSDKPLKQDFHRKLDQPFSLRKWLEQNKTEIDTLKKKTLFGENYVSRIHILGEGIHYPDTDVPETFLWQIEGSSIIDIEKKEYNLCTNQTILVPANKNYILKSDASSRILSVIMNPM
ncbi:hypothetical protein JTE90_014725 [Oedothorax gibbosus]|uniref:3-hydroxyanthranilate 3,4-dioxygenase n=1 Tax=Oedothorax gibbosus TaxID=931172 RepID=A0AAV6URC1_9ARAC|nr:hypothetical protein JTE90_014725 [Oedothorax gibbosus]